MAYSICGRTCGWHVKLCYAWLTRASLSAEYRTHYKVLYNVPFTLLYQLRWRGGATGKAFGLAISRSRVQILLEATLRKNLRQVVYTYVLLSPSSTTWYRPKGGDALRLRR